MTPTAHYAPCGKVEAPPIADDGPLEDCLTALPRAIWHTLRTLWRRP